MGTLLLIDFNIRDISFLISNLTPDTTYVFYHRDSDTSESLLNRIPQGTYANIGIVQDNTFTDTYLFLNSFGTSILEKVETDDPSLNTWVSFIQLLSGLKAFGMTQLDFIECNLGTDPWKYITSKISKDLDLTIGYANNIIGSGGNWILDSDLSTQSDDVQLIGKYFTENVINYPYSLGSSGGGFEFFRMIGHISVINSANRVYTWGTNGNGCAGIGNSFVDNFITTPYALTPTFGGSNVVQISGGYATNIFILANGTAWGAGRNAYGNTGTSNGFNWGAGQALWNNPVQIPGITTAVATLCTSDHTLILLSNGDVYACGYNGWGQLGINNSSIAYTYVLTKCVLPEKIIAVSGYDYIDTGSNYSLFLSVTGSIYGCGDNRFGSLGIGQNDTNIHLPTKAIANATFVAISGGFFYSLALDNMGNIWGTGGTNTTYYYNTGRFYEPLSRTYDTYQLGRGNGNSTSIYTYQQITTGTVYRSISAGYSHSGAIDSSNNLWMWGDNYHGELGFGNNTTVKVPTKTSQTNVMSIIHLGYHLSVIGILVSGNIVMYSCGFNSDSKLRNPTQVVNPPNTQVTAYSSFSLLTNSFYVLPDQPLTFTFTNTPSFGTIFPTTGTRNTPLTITGTNLDKISTVKFGSTNSTSIVTNSSTSLVAYAPAGSGNVSIIMIDINSNNFSYSGNFTYQNPSVTGMTPLAGTTNTILSISGTNLMNTSFVKIQGYNTTFTINSSVLVNASVNASSGNASVVLVDSVGNNTSFSGNFTYQNPTVTSFTPQVGPLNTSVSLSGTNLSNTSYVLFGNASASINLRTGTLVNVSAPLNSGNVSIVVRDNVGNEVTMPGSFTYQNPSVTSFTPVAGTLNTSVSLSGTNLSNTSYVLFGNASASINLRTGTLVNVSVPVNSGNVSIVLRDNLGNNVSMPGSFIYQNPSVNSFTPVASAQNASVSLSGTNLSNTVAVRFGTVNASINLSSGTLVNVSVPANASSNVSIVLRDNVGNEVTMPGSFTYQNPSVTSFRPEASATNTSMTISGENLSNITSVLFGTVNASINSITGSSVNVSVPVNSGNVSIVLIDNVGNNVSAPGSFTYQNLRITALNPPFGAKNTRINISGEKLDNARSVRIGGIQTIFTINSSFLINASLPNSSGNASVSVIDDIGNEIVYDGLFKYQNLNLSAIYPLTGTTNTSVTLTGTSLTNRASVKFGDQTATINRTTATSMNVSVPANTENVSIYVLDNDGNRVDYPESFLYVNPVIEDIEPKAGTKNTSIVLTGKNLTNITTVKIGSTNTTFRINSSVSLNISAPVGTDGNASIQLKDNLNNLIPYSGSFLYQNPSTTSFSSTTGTNNTSVTITGANLSNTTNVFFGINNASINVITGTALNVSVPANVVNTNVSIFVRDNVGNSLTLPGNFTYQNPSVTSMTPLTGTTNTVINISGFNLSNTSFVKIQGYSVPFTTNTSRSVSAIVNASSGNASVVLIDHVGNNVSFSGNFSYVNPTVVGFTPLVGTKNTLLTISGTNMTNTSYVYFGEENASINLRTPTSVNVSVPENDGNVSIRVRDKYNNDIILEESFTYQNLRVTNFNPQKGTSNTSVSLIGYNLSNIRSVRFGTTNASINLSSGTLVNVSAPLKTDGDYSIVLRDHLGNEVTMPGFFTYQNPSVTEFNGSIGTKNTSVTIVGNNLSNTSNVFFGTVNASINLVTGTLLNVSSPNSSGNVSIIVRDNVGNNVTLPGSFFYQNPTITRITPISGSLNTSITISGDNLSNTVSVQFGGVNATILSNTSTSIRTLAPDTSGNVSVVLLDNLGNHTRLSGNFTYQNTIVTGFNPSVGVRNTPVVMTGTFLNNISTIRFGTVNAPIRSKAATTLNVSAPVNTGNVSIFLTDVLGNSFAAPGTFSYQYPGLDSIEPLEGTTNTVLQITGINLANTQTVKLGTTKITKFISKTNTTINLSVTKSTGNVSVVLIDQSGLNTSFSGNFAYKNPAITAITPLFGLFQTPVTINGINFSNTSYVKFGTAFAPIQSITNSTITVLAPSVTGKATITIGDIFKNIISYNIPFVYQTTTITSVLPLFGMKNTPMLITGTNLSNISYVTFGNISTDVIINSSVSIETIVPDSTGSVTLSVVDNVGKITSFSKKFAFANTAITSMTSSGVPKGTIQIKGSNLINTSMVNFDNVSTGFKAYSTYLNVTVPFGYGNVSVEVIDRYGNSLMAPGSFLFKTPAITQISSDSSPVNSTIALYGMNLINTSFISFGTNITKKFTKTTNMINVSVPEGSGNVSLKITDTFGNDILFPRNFIYQNTFISSVTPNNSPPKSTVVIEGGYLSNTSSVIFGTQNTSFNIVSNSLINASVPISSGNVSISVRDNLGNLTTYNELFTYQVMTITQFEPTTGVKNSKILVEGTNFDAVEIVKLGTTPVTFTVISNYQMEVIIPEISGTNQLVILDDYGNTVTSSQFYSQKNPTITTVDKTSGLIGESFAIYGTDLGDIKYVVFGKEQAEDEVITDTQITCTIPYGLGEVLIQVSDNYRNTLSVPDTFTYIQNIPQPNLVLENAPKFTTIDSSGNIYTSNDRIVNKTFTVNDAQVTEPFYTNTRVISGIALDKGILYMCEYEFYDIARYNTTTRIKQTYVIDPLDRVQPNIIKVYKNKLYAICNADPDTTDPDYLYVFDLSSNSVYKKNLLQTYTVQGLAFYNDIIFMSAVIKNSPALGRVYTTDLSGQLINESAITDLDNPIDLTFVNDLLVIDGGRVIIFNVNNLTTPLASYQSSTTSQYNSVFSGTDATGNNVIYMTNTTTNQIETVPAPSVLSSAILATQMSPNYGSENSHIVIQGQNFLDATNNPKIKKILFGNTEAINLSIVSNTLLYCDAPNGSGRVSIQLIDMSDVTISTLLYFTYQKPTILDSYPKQGLEGEKMYIYGNYMNLVDKVLIGPIEATFALIRRDYIRVTIPPGSGTHPITLIDNLQNTITNQAFTYTYYVFNTTICFPAGTLVHTDQGILPIQMIVPGLHSLNQDGIVAITDTYSMDKELICIEKDALDINIPYERTLISPRHKLYYHDKMLPAYQLIGMKGISFVTYQGEKLYNVLLEEYGSMQVQGLLCETLHPDNPVASYFRKKVISDTKQLIQRGK